MSTSFKLYGYPWSASTRRVALIAKERNIPYELVPVDVRRGEHMAPSFAAHQPFNQVPYVVVRLSSHSPLVHPKTISELARRWFRAIRVARHLPLPRHARIWPRVDPHRAPRNRQVRAGLQYRVCAVGPDCQYDWGRNV